MKRFTMILLALLLCASCVLAEDWDAGICDLSAETGTEEELPMLMVSGPALGEGDLSVEDAIAEAKAIILSDHETGANLNMGMDDVSAEGLGACYIEVRVFDRIASSGIRRYEIDFKQPEAEAYYAWVVLLVEGEQVMDHNYGNG